MRCGIGNFIKSACFAQGHTFGQGGRRCFNLRRLDPVQDFRQVNRRPKAPGLALGAFDVLQPAAASCCAAPRSRPEAGENAPPVLAAFPARRQTGRPKRPKPSFPTPSVLSRPGLGGRNRPRQTTPRYCWRTPIESPSGQVWTTAADTPTWALPLALLAPSCATRAGQLTVSRVCQQYPSVKSNGRLILARLCTK